MKEAASDVRGDWTQPGNEGGEVVAEVGAAGEGIVGHEEEQEEVVAPVAVHHLLLIRRIMI